jgi:hypothetical protein
VRNGALEGTHGTPAVSLDHLRAELKPLADAWREVQALIATPGPERDTAEYALDFGVSMDEARRRMAVQMRNEPGELQALLMQKEPATFGGLWIEHEPKYRVVVSFTRDPAATLAKYTKDPIFVPRLTTISERDLLALTQRTMQSLPLGVSAGGSGDIKTGRVALYVATWSG